MRYIDQEKIYEATEQGLTIFQHYFPIEDIRDHKKFLKVRDEKTASARVTWYQNFWRLTDFGNQGELNGVKGIEFVMWKEGLAYYDALLYIEQVIIRRTVGGKEFVGIRWAAEYEMREMTAQDKKGDYNFTYKEHPSTDDLSAIGRYVTEEHLTYFFGKSVEKYEYCGPSKKLNRDVVHIFKATRDYPMFVFDYGDFKKLYKPHDPEKKNRFLYIGKKPKDYIYGLKQIKKADNEFADSDHEELHLPEDKPSARVVDIFRCSGESDALNLFSLGFHAYWLNSESADLDYKTYKEVDDLCDNHYQIMDLDATGQEEAIKNALKHINLFSIELPGWLKFKKDWRGNPCKDLKDFINLSGDDEDSTRYDFLILKRRASKVKFWTRAKDEKTGKVNYGINMEFMFFFLRANGFYQMESVYHKKAGYCYVHIKGKVVELIHPDDIKRRIKRYIKDWIKSKKLMDALEILNKINTSNQITEANVETIDTIELNFKNYNHSTEHLHFRNGSIRITRDKIEKIKQSDIPNFILGKLEINNKTLSHLIDRDIRVIEKPAIEIHATKEYQAFTDRLQAAKDDDERAIINAELAQLSDLDKYQIIINDEDFIFVRFLRDLCRMHWRKQDEKKEALTTQEIKEENLALANLLFVIGYHGTQYKDPAKAWVTFMQDMRVSDIGTASGRSGKSVLSKAISFIRLHFYIGGRKLDDRNAYQFIYDGMTEFHDFIEVDDFHERAIFDFFYTQITGPREINPKNYSPFTLDYVDSGKMLISSNYELPDVNSSTLGRLLNCGISDYYHEKTKYNDYKETRSPLTKFGRLMFDDFTEEEWVKFFNLAAYCIQMQMRFFKINPPVGNLDKRQLRKTMSLGLGRDEEFFHWANSYFVHVPKGEVLPKFSPDDQGYLNVYIYRDICFERFTSNLTQQQKSAYKAPKFKKHLEAWCEYNGYELNPENLCTDLEYRKIAKTIEGKTRELFFISTLPKGSEATPGEAPNSDDAPF